MERQIRIRAILCLAIVFSICLSGCAVDNLKYLDVVYDLSQQDQKDANKSALIILGPDTSQEPMGLSSLPESMREPIGGNTAEQEKLSPPAAEEPDEPPLEEESFEEIPENMELSTARKSLDDVEKEDEAKRQEIGLDDPRIEEIMAENGGRYYFDQLSPELKRVYAEIYQIITKRGQKIKVSTLSEDDVDRAFTSLLADHPEIFVADGYTYTRYTTGGELVKLGFTARYLYSEEEEAARREAIEDAVRGIVANAPETSDQYELVKYIYEYIIDNTEYMIGAPDNQNVCSVFITHNSVCQGYAKAAQLLMNRLGIPSTLVTGTVTSAGREPARHAWNLANVNGNYYFLDPTWGDSSFQQINSEEESGRKINYDYLLVTSDDLAVTHHPDDTVELPKCTELADNYYVRDGARFDGVNEGQLQELFNKAYAEGRDSVTVKCADYVTYLDMTQYLVTDKHLFDYLRNNGESASFVSSEAQRTLTFVLSTK